MDKELLKCLIVEDEPIAAEVLTDYIAQVPFLELEGTCKDAIFALDLLGRQPIEVLFLDLHLPKLKGLDFLRSLPEKPQTILTTAYDQYALDAFDAGVVDYLMKPIEFSRFLRAVNKLRRPQLLPLPPRPAAATRPFHFFNVNKKMVKVAYDEILYLESLKDYTRIVMTDRKIVTRSHLGEMEIQLRPFSFLRIHRSYIVSLPQISAYSATEITLGAKALPIGRSYKNLVGKALDDYFGGY